MFERKQRTKKRWKSTDEKKRFFIILFERKQRTKERWKSTDEQICFDKICVGKGKKDDIYIVVNGDIKCKISIFN